MSDPYLASVASMRRQRDAEFARDPQSPIEDKEGFRGLSYFEADPAFRVASTLVRHTAPATLMMQTSDGQARQYRNVGHFEFELRGVPVRLQAYQQRGQTSLFAPFRDQTSGKETYGAGRYLDVHLEHGDAADIDFNFAYNPYCAYSPLYSCPLPPQENWLPVRIEAGERVAQGG